MIPWGSPTFDRNDAALAEDMLALHRRAAFTRAGLHAFFNIADAWELSEIEQIRLLGIESGSTFEAWRSGTVEVISRDALERISYVLGIYRALHVLLPNDAAADAWVRRPNRAPLFNGRSALDRMILGNVGDLFEVRQYLDAQQSDEPP